MRYRTMAAVASTAADAEAALAALADRYPLVEPADADVIIALGGDGFMLETQHRLLRQGKPIYGMSRGTVGFLMNEFSIEDLPHGWSRRTARPCIHSACRRRRSTGIRTRRSPSTRSRCCARPAKPPSSESAWMASSGCRSLSATVCWWRLPPAAPPTTFLPTARSSRSAPTSWRSRRSAPSGRGAGEAPAAARGDRAPRGARARQAPGQRGRRLHEVRDVASVEVAVDHATAIHLLFDPEHSLTERILAEQFTP